MRKIGLDGDLGGPSQESPPRLRPGAYRLRGRAGWGVPVAVQHACGERRLT